MGIVTTTDGLKYLSQGSITLCHGVFDVLHEGHLRYLEEAKKLTPYLVVSVTSDKYVNKGPGRPYFCQDTRARMLAALEIVNFVVINDKPTATDLIKEIKPKYYVKGPDYKDRSSDLTKGIFEEEEAIKSVGGEIIFTSCPTHSSSTLINRFFSSFTDEQSAAIAKVKELGGIEKIKELFADIEKLSVTVIGEPIVDTYVFCEPEGISSKSPTISARYEREEDYAGGSMAIANHLADFVRGVYLFAPYGRELYFQSIKANMVDKRVAFMEAMFPNYITPRKTRFIDKDKGQRVFELTKMTPSIWDEYKPGPLLDKIHSNAEDTSMVMLCDFGHGLFEGPFLNSCKNFGFTALNCQTNSSNFGYNPYTKHDGVNYLSIDLREARVAFHDRYSQARHLFSKIKTPYASMTLGSGGALYSQEINKAVHVPAFADKIVDTIGAGDAYYAITSLLVKVGAPDEMVPFIGNIFAGLKTKIIGNKFSVTKAQLFKALEAILK